MVLSTRYPLPVQEHPFARLRGFHADHVSFEPTGMPDYTPEHTDQCM
ncbi:hypothetical protein XOC_0004 [Xanthomonas oryzae pv. oryzicola BLS256]|uniref:Uncharacterized protein n=1 Tax=Xanthomonas oryzae pv. oryzicola (strain BLS256) TaxID=383407 RepID=G7THU1_XANOB|nr:hypothetical protein XOC_0004 [Xanthomonas oryzae pv. oryzicola BLS256]QEO94999.1 hypothetical protein XOCgx_0003 [Xanthomonas oryzae pv. oryzicola]